MSKPSKGSVVLKQTTDRREYKSIIKWIDPWDESDRWLVNRVNRGRVGYHTRKGIHPCQARAYRTWKHNRKTQYK